MQGRAPTPTIGKWDSEPPRIWRHERACPEQAPSELKLCEPLSEVGSGSVALAVHLFQRFVAIVSRLRRADLDIGRQATEDWMPLDVACQAITGQVYLCASQGVSDVHEAPT